MGISTKIRVVIADPVSAARSSLRRIVESYWAWEAVGEAQDGFEAVRTARTTQADVLLVDSTIGGLPTREIRLLLSASPTLVVVLLEQPGDHATQMGPSALKSIPADALKDVVTEHLYAHWSRRSIVADQRS